MASLFKIANIFILFCILSSCSSVEFVYNKSNTVGEFKKNTTIVSMGNESEYLLSYLARKLEAKEEGVGYTLKISSQIEESITATNQDQSAASYYINGIVQYELINNIKKCIIYLDIIETGFSYNTKSEGYDFGTEKSIEKNNKQNFEYTAEVFLKQISSLPKNAKCINENKT